MKWKPSGPFITGAELLKPTGETTSNGVRVKTYGSGEQINVNFRTFGGTEKVINGILTVENTGTVETWFRPDIKSDCRVQIGSVCYEIIGEPENIEMRNKYLVFKVRAVKGGA